MSKRYYKKNGLSGKQVAAIVIAVILVVIALICGVSYSDQIGSFFKDVGKSVGVTSKTEENEDFKFSRAYIRYNKDNAGNEPRAINYEFEVSEELMREVDGDADKRYAFIGISLSKYSNYLREAQTHEKVVEMWIRDYAESEEQTEDEWLEDLFDSTSENLNPDRNFSIGGDVVNMLRLYTSIADEDLNARRVIGALIITAEEDDTYTYQVASLGGKAYDDLDVSPSLAYLASRYLNEMNRYSALYSAELEGYCQDIVKKAHCLATGTDVSGYADVALTVDTSTVFTMSVGDTKKLSVDLSVETDVDVVYMEETYNSIKYAGAFEITADGFVKAYKEGTYEYVVCVFGQKYVCTLEVTA